MNDFPKIASARMRAVARSESHPEADMLNAFAEKALTDEERGRVMGHLSQCQDCREILMFALPENLELQSVLSPGSSGWRWPNFRWVALTAGVAVLVAGMSLRHFSAHDSIGIVATANPQLESRAVAPPSAFPAPVLTNDRSKVKPTQKASPASDERFETLNADSNDVPSTTVESFAPNASRETARVMARTTVNLTPRWTLTEDGALQRSLDSGKTWSPISVAPNAAFRAVAASGQHIWVGGSKGSLYCSLDAGQSWSRVRPLAGSESLADDITNIALTGDHHVSLGTASATWSSSDSGLTWQKK